MKLIKKSQNFVRFLLFNAQYLFYRHNSHKLKKNTYDVILMSADENKYTHVEKKYFDRYLDPIFVECNRQNIQCLSILRPFSRLSVGKTFSESSKIDRQYFWAYFWDLVFNYHFENYDSNFYANSNRVKLYVKILKRIRPKVILSVNYPAELCVAARHLNIPLVEVLHAKGYSVNPSNWLSRGSVTPINPSYVMVFDKKSIQLIKESNLKIKIIEVEDIPYRFIKNSKESIKLKIVSGKNHKTILVALSSKVVANQNHFDEILNDGILPNSLIDTIQHFGEKYKWVIRPHPLQMLGRDRIFREQRKYLLKKLTSYRNVQLQMKPDVDIYETLMSVDVLATNGSLVVYEGVHSGVSTVLLSNATSTPAYSDLIVDKKITVIQDTSDEFIDYLTNMKEKISLDIYRPSSSQIYLSDLPTYLLSL